MAELLIRDVDEETMQSLIVQAEQHGRSLDVELKDILRQATVESTKSMADARRAIEDFRRRGPVQTSNSTDLLVEDRAR